MSLAMLVVPFLPATNLFFRVGFVIAERVLYLSSAGGVMLVVLGANALSSRHKKVGYLINSFNNHMLNFHQLFCPYIYYIFAIFIYRFLTVFKTRLCIYFS